jgi:glycosyltransferase involved in cell wall biosynthesis
MAALAGRIARAIPALLPVLDERAPLRVLVASLAPGGAERIVLEWLAAEAARGRAHELAVVHARRNALPVPLGVRARTRERETPQAFMRSLARDWIASPAPVSTHLVTDDLLALLWEAGVRTTPVVHNSRAGWRNDVRAWRPDLVPGVIACADAVRAQLLEERCPVPVVTLRHRPCVGAAAFDVAARAAIRAELGIAPGMFLVGAIGALKPQKDHARAIDVLARLSSGRDAALVILGGVLDGAGLAELDRVIAAAVAHRVQARLRLPGFVTPIEPWLAACDALLNVSRFEGLSIGAQEALAAGLPVVATHVGGQGEISHPLLELVDPESSPGAIADLLARHPVRTTLAGRPWNRAPRAWTVASASRRPRGPRCATIFVTANLNAGGAQRSLCNLAGAIASQHALAVAVCGDSAAGAFAQQMREAGIEAFRPCAEPDAFAVAESLLAHAGARAARNICFWNADPRVKLLVAKFAPPEMRLVDVSPGGYSFEEMEAAREFAEAIATSPREYYRRLDALVLKYRESRHPPCARVEVISNGVSRFDAAPGAPRRPRYLVSGRIAPSKRLETIVDAFGAVAARHPGAELHVVGSVDERHAAYADAIAARARGLAVRWRGPSFDFSALAEPFTATVVLGTHQGSPNAVLEAMAAGIPVIANDSGGTRELVIAGVTGCLLPEDAGHGELAAAMIEAFEDGAGARERAVHARERVRREFTLEAMAARYLDLLG